MKVLIACGGTGGHLLPAISFLEDLKSKCESLQAMLVVARRNIEEGIAVKDCRIACVNFLPLRLCFNEKNKLLLLPLLSLKNAKALVRLLTGLIQSAYIILNFRPRIVVGFGGYAAFALVFLARLSGAKTIVYEPNARMGISNRLLARFGFADIVAVSFRREPGYPQGCGRRIFFTPNPRWANLVKVNKHKAREFFGISKDKFTILAMGGSLGSSKINGIIIETLREFPAKNKIQVIHLSGENDYNRLLNEYTKIDIEFKLFKFFKAVHYAYCAADLSVCRGGANTIGELIFFNLPSIVIPYPFAYQHQFANAEILSEKKAALVIEDSKLNASALSDIVFDLFNNRSKIDQMRVNLEGLKPEGHYLDLSDLALSLRK